MSARREHMQEEFQHRRENDAEALLNDMLTENSVMHEHQKKYEASLNTPRKAKSPKRHYVPLSSRSDVCKEPSIPMLSLEELETNIHCAEMVVTNKKPSLMAQTIMDLKRKESLKSAETDRLLKGMLIINGPVLTELFLYLHMILKFTSMISLVSRRKMKCLCIS